MSKRDWKILAEDIVSSIEKIESYTKELSFDDFAINTMAVDAVVRNLEIIGEAAAKIPVEIQSLHSSIPWKKLKGIRNRIVHEYFSVDISIIWFIVSNELQSLKQNLLNISK